MEEKFGRKGLSTVVATVLLMLLTVIAVVIISQVLVPFVKTNLNIASECINYREYFVFDDSFGYVCYDQDDQNGITVTAKGEDNGSIVGFDLVFNKNKDSQKVSARRAASITDLRMLNGSITNIKIPKKGETLSYVYLNGADSKKYDGVDIYPVIKSGDGERICEKSDSIKLKPCDNGISLSV